MPTLSLHRKHKVLFALPYWVLVDGYPIGIMRGSDAEIDIPSGRHEIEVRVVLSPRNPGLWVGGSRSVLLSQYEVRDLVIGDRERWWNILFSLDLVLWVIEFFIILPPPWHAVYEVLSNGFFIVWLIRLYIVRKQYFCLSG